MKYLNIIFDHRSAVRQVCNRMSGFLHILLAMLLCFIIESCSHRSIQAAITFVTEHTFAFLFNSAIIYVSLLFVYLMRRRTVGRIFISSFWLLLGIVNGCVLASRVTPFGYTDLKCVGDLLTMQDSKYFTLTQEIIIICSLLALFVFLVVLFFKGPKFKGKIHYIRSSFVCAGSIALLVFTRTVAQDFDLLAGYFSNIAEGYTDYGFLYGFSSSVFDRGMNKPSDYSENTILAIKDDVASKLDKITKIDVADSQNVASDAGDRTKEPKQPNIICILLESFIDPDEINFLQCSDDPIPTFHKLTDNYTSGYLTVPVVGAGTANTEFEILTGMSLQYFGTGEYPYKTILKQTNCESIASDLSDLGYGTHVVHNNGGNFYSRANAFSQMGFDTFTSKEMMNISEYTPLGSWPTDDILVSETLKALDDTPDQSDFVYTITVQGHGAYPTEKVIADPEITVTGSGSRETDNQWEYYVNQIHEVDKFIKKLTDSLARRDEDTLVVMFGDHLPTMSLTDEDMKSNDIFKTRYATWNNFGLKKEDADLTSYQLLSYITNQMDIHDGTIFSYHQAYQADASDNAGRDETSIYMDGLENLQYDILYGEKYIYDGVDKYPATDLQMGVDPIGLKDVASTDDDTVVITGSNFTPWSKVFVNNEKVATTFVNDTTLTIKSSSIQYMDDVFVGQVSGDTIFARSITRTALHVTPQEED
ncbi:MAG: LTA synthase family protein [Lachnospiraceae bacterium]|nr:LTA synthase family protein [Lachnospiraceae bacterium]